MNATVKPSKTYLNDNKILTRERLYNVIDCRG
jgi:hypothetical protein